MSPFALRASAFGLGLLAFALRAVHSLWWHPASRRGDGSSAWVLLIGGYVAPALIAFGVFALLAYRAGRPAGFEVHERTFVAPSSPIYGGNQAIMMMFLAAGMVPELRSADPTATSLTWDPIAATFIAVFVVAAVAILLVRRPWLRLDHDGLMIQHLRRRVFARWADLASGGPLAPRKKNPRYLRLYLAGPPMWGAIAPGEDIPVGWLHIAPAFLAAAIRHYVENPEYRAAIGSPEELLRLQAALDESADTAASVGR